MLVCYLGELKVDGEIVVNGRHIGQHMRFLSGFMYQEDLFLPYLTAKEHLNIMVSECSFQLTYLTFPSNLLVVLLLI